MKDHDVLLHLPDTSAASGFLPPAADFATLSLIAPKVIFGLFIIHDFFQKR